jgi:hypothetical protein
LEPPKKLKLVLLEPLLVALSRKIRLVLPEPLLVELSRKPRPVLLKPQKDPGRELWVDDRSALDLALGLTSPVESPRHERCDERRALLAEGSKGRAPAVQAP